MDPWVSFLSEKAERIFSDKVIQDGEEKMQEKNFPGGPVVTNLPGRCRGHSFSLRSKKMPHGTGATGTCALQQEKPPQLEARAPHLESSPHLPQLEKANAQQ